MKAERNHARLYRSSDDVVIAGVCAGVADYLGLPSGKVRLATLLLVLVGGLSIWVYILLWIVVPKGPKRLEGNSRVGPSPARDCTGRGLRISDMRTGPGAET